MKASPRVEPTPRAVISKVFSTRASFDSSIVLSSKCFLRVTADSSFLQLAILVC